MRSVRRDTRDAILVSMKRALEAVKVTDDVSAAGLSAFSTRNVAELMRNARDQQQCAVTSEQAILLSVSYKAADSR